MNKKSRQVKTLKLTDHFTYSIADNIIYLFQNDIDVSLEEFKIAFRKVSLLIEDYDISYINISAKRIEDRKEFYQKLGFILSHYDVNKLNELYDGKKNKIDYKCYGIMTKRDFFERMNMKEEYQKREVMTTRKNSGYVSSMLLLFGGIAFLCYLCVQGAILLVS